MSFNTPGPPPPGHVLRSPQGLATATVVLLCVTGGINLLSAGANVFTLSLMNDLDADPARVTSSMTDLSDILIGLAGLLQVLMHVATGVVFLVWFYRVRVNGGIFRATEFTQGSGWAIGWWFVPVAHLFQPFVVARQIWRASTQLGPDGSPSGSPAHPSRPGGQSGSPRRSSGASAARSSRAPRRPTRWRPPPPWGSAPTCSSLPRPHSPSSSSAG